MFLLQRRFTELAADWQSLGWTRQVVSDLWVPPPTNGSRVYPQHRGSLSEPEQASDAFCTTKGCRPTKVIEQNVNERNSLLGSKRLNLPLQLATAQCVFLPVQVLFPPCSLVWGEIELLLAFHEQLTCSETCNFQFDLTAHDLLPLKSHATENVLLFSYIVLLLQSLLEYHEKTFFPLPLKISVQRSLLC